MKTFCTLKPQTVILFFVLVMSTFSMFSQTEYTINDPGELEDQTYVPGDVIILTNGTYDNDGTIDFVGNGTSDEPIIFKAQTSGGVIFNNGLQLNIGGDHVIVDGFYWQGGDGSSSVIEFRNGSDYANNSTIQNCVMDGLTLSDEDIANGLPDPDDPDDNGSIAKHNWIMLYGTYNTVINCSFLNKESAGNMVLVELAYNDEDNPCAIVGHTISNNYFYKFEKIDSELSNAGDSETIRIGTSSYQQVNSYCTVSNNYFVEADGENEIITNKSKNNIYTNNTFRRSRGSLVLRHGSNALVDGNYFLGGNVDGTGGVRIVDSEHTITNNYIQDCITVIDQTKWNNGITFLGGSANNSVACDSGSTSSDYQKVENINLSNNTIINTNAPLYYNTDKGSTDPTGDVNNNLIYFTDDYDEDDLTPVISGDTPTSYDNLGTALDYDGNVYTGTTLGATNAGFSEETGIVATADGEIFTFSGTGSSGKGADMGTYEPTTDDMVGYGIGACFLDYLGNSISDGECTIEQSDFLTVSSLSTFTPDASSENVTVNTNVSWTAISNDGWITIDTASGTGNATVSVSVTENTETSSRTGSVTFTQDAGGDDIVRNINVTQEGADLTDIYDLINTGEVDDPVIVDSWSKQEVNGVDKFNYATNTLDKDMASVWAADDLEAIPSGDYYADGEYVIYDLGSEYDLDLIQFNTTNKSDAFGVQILVSTIVDPDADDFDMILPTSGDLLFTATNTTEFNQYEVDATARYVKLLGYGRFNSAGDTRTSVWTAIGEIEFFGNASLSVDEYGLANNALIYPNPSNEILYIKNIDNQINSVSIHSVDGRKIMDKTIGIESEINFDVSEIANGTYFVTFKGKGVHQSKLIIISH